MPQEQRPTEKFRTSVGGQALMEGIMMRGPEKICCAVRRPDGTIDLSYSDVTTHWYNKVPLVRGVCNMVENLMNGYKYLMHSADIAMSYGDVYTSLQTGIIDGTAPSISFLLR